jgi:rubrerythrin
MSTDARARLVALLRLAYSGERAAAYAYRGHARSVSDADQRQRIRTIEDEEWHHRRLVGEMLRELGARPSPWRELRAMLVGRVLQIGCHLSGWFAPMYGAGRLESHNIREYENAAQLAHDCGRDDLVDCLLTMAEVEWEHERYFRSLLEGHPWTRVFKVWPPPPPRESIRARFPAHRSEVA